MKRRNLLSSVVFCAVTMFSSVSVWAQADIDVTPDRFKFGPDSEIAVGPFQVDKTYPDWNPPASYAPAKDGNTDGYVLFHGDGSSDFNLMKSAFNVIDLGGEVGKVLCLAAGADFKDLMPYAVGPDAGWIPHTCMTIYAPAELPVERGTLRFTVTYKAYQEEPTDEVEFFKFYAKNWSNDNSTQVLCYSGGRKGTEGEDEWKTYESEINFDDPAAQFPICCKFEFPRIAGNVLLIKEMTFTLNPSEAIIDQDEPVSTDFVMNPSTNISNQNIAEFTYSVSGDVLNINGLNGNEDITVYSILGSEVVSVKATSTEANIPLAKGVYIVKVASKSFKVLN